MYEFSVARKYLVPRVRQLSVSCISLISVLVIAIVVWLSIVFFSAQEGIERKWTEKMVALTSPIRLTPTSQYYQSYYYQIDSFSSASNFSPKTLPEKLESALTDPFDEAQDPSLPRNFPQKSSIDIVKTTQEAINSIPGLTASVFETGYATVQIQTFRERDQSEIRISQACYVAPFDKLNPLLKKSILTHSLVTLSDGQLQIPKDGILLPKSFKEAGVHLGDHASLIATGFGTITPAQLRLKGRVVGFYDPGIIPIGGKVILASDALVATLTHASLGDERMLPTGFNVHMTNLTAVDQYKEKLLKALSEKGLLPYWNVETFKEFEFTKDIFQQMQSDRNLFSLISLIIIVVASSNIVSMLIILVHDKKREIAIMQALGATKKSIALIFGFCGFCMGAIGALIGSILAYFTLKNLQALLHYLGKLQGFEVLTPAFYGDALPTELSLSAFIFVIIACALASTMAGIIAAVSACRVHISEALKE
jgi:lipoprotein-releasing system permease protein